MKVHRHRRRARAPHAEPLFWLVFAAAAFLVYRLACALVDAIAAYPGGVQ